MKTINKTNINNNAETENKLYNVYTIAKEFPHRNGIFGNVRIYWLRAEVDLDNPPVPYDVAIHEAIDIDNYTRGYICEAFTWKEAVELRKYLQNFNGSETFIEEIKLPITENMMGCGAAAVGGTSNFYSLYKHNNYPLKFKVEGFYDVEGSKFIRINTMYKPPVNKPINTDVQEPVCVDPTSI